MHLQSWLWPTIPNLQNFREIGICVKSYSGTTDQINGKPQLKSDPAKHMDTCLILRNMQCPMDFYESHGFMKHFSGLR